MVNLWILKMYWTEVRHFNMQLQCFFMFAHFGLILQEYCITEYLRMSGVYWGLTAMFLMNKQDMMEKDEILEFVQSCQHDNGGFGASENHDSHLLYTLSAIQVYTAQPKHNA